MSFPEALIENFPALSVNVVLFVPFTWTVTPLNGLLSSSVTVPVMACEKAAAEKSRRENKKRER
jgi:hypothetical protein